MPGNLSKLLREVITVNVSTRARQITQNSFKLIIKLTLTIPVLARNVTPVFAFGLYDMRTAQIQAYRSFV